ASRAAREEERHAANELLLQHAQEAQLFRFMAERSEVPFFINDPSNEMRLVYVNDAAVRHFGYPREEVLQMRVTDFDAAMTREQLDVSWKELKEKGSMMFETVHRVSGGRMVPVEVSVNYFSFEG